jgi:PAS domain S-box-containing protein
LPAELQFLKDLLQSQDIKSIFVLPMVVNRKIAGFYGFDSVVKQKQWTENEADLLKLASEIICNVFSRVQWENDRDRFRTVFENAAFGAIIVNKSEKIIYANKYTSNLMNCSLQQLQKLSFNNLFPTFLNGNNEVGYDEMIKIGSKESFEMMHPMPDGSVAVLLTNAVCITGSTNNETLVAYTFSDITGRKEQEKATTEALNIVSEQNKRLLNFSYIVSHNIRSHSSNISGIASILAEDPEAEVRHQFVEGLVSSSKNLDSTLRHLNELLNIQSRVNIHKETVPLKEVVDRTIQAIGLDVKANNVQFDLQISEDFTLSTDRAYLDSVVFNLISNAIKYRKPEAHPIIKIQSGEFQKQNWFSISDNGMGIDLKKYGDRIFGMFKTFHGNRDARGIGLFITRNQIEALGGKIEVDSAPGQGTTFTIYLPK